MPDSSSDAAHPPLPPPAYFFALLILGAAAQYIHPLDINRSGSLVHVWAGFAATTSAGLLMLWSIVTLGRHQTSPDLHRSTTALVKSGPYAHTRNPLYVALLTVFAGIGFIANSWWILGLTPLLVACLHFAVVKREEAYLARKFGEEYLGYTRKVRRWI